MKHRCQCGKPEGYGLGCLEWKIDNVTALALVRMELPEHAPILHFKSADRECKRCGAPLCGDCQVPVLHYVGDGTINRVVPILAYCRTCAELESERCQS